MKMCLRFLTENQIIEDMLAKMSLKDQATWRQVDEKDLISGHHGTGRSIRNRYGLWNHKNPHVNLHDVNGPDFPDQMSQRIIERIWKKIQERELENA